MARNNRGGKISRGTCEGCGLDLGNRLDPYCWACAKQLERVIEQRMRERRRELEVARQEPEQARRIALRAAIDEHIARLQAAS